MKLLKKLFLIFLALIAILLLIALFLPSKVRVERSLVIGTSPVKIFEQINVLTNWEKWSPWHKLDPNMKLQYSGPPAGEGAKYAWQSQQHNVGNGTLTISKSVTNELLETAMHFDDGDGTGVFKLEKNQNATRVVWSMETDMGKNPIGRYVGLMMDKMVGPDFEKGLNNLKAICEAK